LKVWKFESWKVRKLSKKALKINDEGVELGKKGLGEKAINKFLQGLEIEPDNPVILSNIGLANTNLKKYDEAVIYFNKSLAVSDSTHLLAGTGLASLYNRIGAYNKVISISNYVINKSEDSFITVSAYIQLVSALILLEECEEALNELNTIEKFMQEIDDSEKSKTTIREHLNYLKNEIDRCVKRQALN